MTNVKDQLSRMKGLMSYGLQTENKAPFSSVEFSKNGADGKLYGIIREGSKYYIKVCESGKKGLVKEDYDYIGGFRNRKENQYESYAKALKNFDMKLSSLKEANSPESNIITESWNMENNHNISSESADKMLQEINRQRQIMYNASLISEGKKCKDCGVGGNPFTIDADKYFKDLEKTETEKRNIKEPKDEAPKGDPKGVKVQEGKMHGNVCPECGKEKEQCTCECGTFECNEESDVLAWRRKGEPENDHYMDMSHGTEIGDSAPFDGTENEEMENGVVEEEYHGIVMHDTQDQNRPEVGTAGRNGAKDVDAPFDDSDDDLNEAIEDTGDELDDVEDAEPEEFDMDEPSEEKPEELDVDEPGEESDSLEERISSIERLLDKIADKLDIDEFEDDDLYSKDDDEGEFDVEMEDEPAEMENPDDDEGDVQTFESRAYKQMMIREAMRKKKMNEENRLDVFGKHPAYQKKVMTIPPKDHREFDGYYDMNDDSVRNDKPFGLEIGDGAPFEVDIEKIENAIAESIKRYLKKK